MAGKCKVNTVCGEENPGEARWWYGMRVSPVDHELYPQFTSMATQGAFGAACCDKCKVEIERRMFNALRGR